MFTRLLILNLTFLFSGCSLIKNSEHPEIIFSETARLKYEGNSTAAMSSIGIMGIALGIAIDEGIAKEIEDRLAPNGGSKNILRKCLSYRTNQLEHIKITKITIEGISIIPTGNGYYASIKGVFSHKKQEEPFEIGKSSWSQTASLTELKSSADIVSKILNRTCQGF